MFEKDAAMVGKVMAYNILEMLSERVTNTYYKDRPNDYLDATLNLFNPKFREHAKSKIPPKHIIDEWNSYFEERFSTGMNESFNDSFNDDEQDYTDTFDSQDIDSMISQYNYKALGDFIDDIIVRIDPSKMPYLCYETEIGGIDPKNK